MRLDEIDTSGIYGTQVKIFCPLCHHKRKTNTSDKSLAVNLENGLYDCHHCGEHGRLEGFSGTPFANNKTKEYKKPDKAQLVKDAVDLDPRMVDYFKTRGITSTTLAKFGITFGPSFPEYEAPGVPLKNDNGIPVVHPGIRFPYYEDGELVFVKHYGPKEFFEDGKKRFRSFKGGKPVPFGYDSEGKTLVIVEGEIDALSIAQQVEDVAVWSVPTGAKGLGWLQFPGVVAKLKSMDKVFIAVDQDEEGIELRKELSARLGVLIGKARLSIVTWPMGFKDANDVLVGLGQTQLVEAVTTAEPIPLEGISLVDEFVSEYMNYYKNGMPKGTSTGIETLDPIYRVMPGMLTIMTGVTNHGKSEVMDEIVRCMIETAEWKFAYYTPENDPMALHMIKLAQRYIGKPFDRKRDGYMSPEEAAAAAQWMYENIYYINARGSAYTVDEILDHAKALFYRYGINGLIIDPWNYVKKEFNGLREDQFINNEMQKIQIFCKETGIHTWLTVHPRTLRQDGKGNIKTPNVHNLSGGSKFGDNADFILCVERFPKIAFETGIHEVVVHNQKSRYYPAARQGNVSLEWIEFNGRFKKLGEPVIGVPADEEDEEGQDGFDEF